MAAFFLRPTLRVSLRTQVVALVARHRVPAIFFDPVCRRTEHSVSYGADSGVMFQRLPYVDRILRGERRASLFRQPTIYRLVVDLNTAKALHLTLPDTLLVAADR